MATNSGMLGELFSPTFKNLRQDEIDEEQRLRFLAENPSRAAAYTGLAASRMAGQGLGRTVAAAAGHDPRTPAERNVQAIEAAKQQVAALGFDPEDPKSIDSFYKQVIQILQKQGLAAEAMTVAKEWRTAKTADAKSALENEKLELERNKLKQREERDRRAHELGILRVVTAQEMAAARNTTAKEIADAKLTAEQKKDGPFKAIDYNDRVEIINRHGEVISIKQKGMSPKDDAKGDEKTNTARDAYAEYMAGLQRQYNAAVQLHNHPGVAGITGKWGRWVGEDKGAPIMGGAASLFASKHTARALALHEQVVGGAFLAGLAKLKAASKTGATGLGAVSEREGDKVQADAAALNRLQDAEGYRLQLATYIREMEGFADRMAAAAQKDGINAIPLQKQTLKVPSGSRSVPAPAAAPAAPAAPASEPKTVGSDRVRVKAPNGDTGTIPRSQLQDALQRGYTEEK